ALYRVPQPDGHIGTRGDHSQNLRRSEILLPAARFKRRRGSGPDRQRFLPRSPPAHADGIRRRSAEADRDLSGRECRVMPFTNEQLIELSEHVFYEAGMLAVAAINVQRCVEKLKTEEDRRVRALLDADKNMALESILLHGRAIFQFLHSIGNRYDDVNANDYITSYVQTAIGALTKDNFYHDIGKKVMHITYPRVSKNAWDVLATSKDLLS